VPCTNKWRSVGSGWPLVIARRRLLLTGVPDDQRSPGLGQSKVGNHWSGCGQLLTTAPTRVPLCCIPPIPSFLPPTPKFLHMWSTLPHWLEHMPALPKLLQKTSNIHNFWFVGLKNMKFVLPWSLLWSASSQKVSKNKNKNWDQVTMPKIGLSVVWIFGPLGVRIGTIFSKISST
jgi:hypothetical protein